MATIVVNLVIRITLEKEIYSSRLEISHLCINPQEDLWGNRLKFIKEPRSWAARSLPDITKNFMIQVKGMRHRIDSKCKHFAEKMNSWNNKLGLCSGMKASEEEETEIKKDRDKILSAELEPPELKESLIEMTIQAATKCTSKPISLKNPRDTHCYNKKNKRNKASYKYLSLSL